MFDSLGYLGGKTVMHLSHNDLDGYAPKIVSNFSNLNTSEFIPLGYDKFDQSLSELLDLYETQEDLKLHALLITDIAPKSHELLQRMQALHEKGLTIVLLDHHDTNNFIEDAFPEWAFVQSTLEGKKTCGTELLYLYLRANTLFPAAHMDSKYLQSFVEHVRSYDTWDWSRNGNVAAKELNSLFFLINPNDFTDIQFDKIQNHINDPEAVSYTFNDFERTLIQVENAREEDYIKGLLKRMTIRDWTIDGTDYKVGVAFAEQFISTAGNALNEKHPECDFIVLVEANKKKLSLRTIHSTIHVGNIAKALHPGGGGHQPAAGCKVDGDLLSEGIESILGVIKEPDVMPAKKKGTFMAKIFQK